MIIAETDIEGAYIIKPDRYEDERGSFLRAWCKKEFEKHGLVSDFVQLNISVTKKAGTLRGLHFQLAPHQEVKLIHCTRGALYDVILDMRADSPTFKQWFSIELRAGNYKMLYIPEGVAHGFQTLEDDTEVYYPVSRFHCPEAERCVRWNDPTFEIKWPHTESRILSDKDNYCPDWST